MTVVYTNLALFSHEGLQTSRPELVWPLALQSLKTQATFRRLFHCPEGLVLISWPRMALQPSHPLSGKQNGGGAGLQPLGHALAVCITSPHSHLPECSYATLRSKEGWKCSLSPRQYVVSQKQNNFCGSFQKGNHHVQKERGLSLERVSKGSLRGSCPLPATSVSRTQSRPCVCASQSSLP